MVLPLRGILGFVFSVSIDGVFSLLDFLIISIDILWLWDIGLVLFRLILGLFRAVIKAILTEEFVNTAVYWPIEVVDVDIGVIIVI